MSAPERDAESRVRAWLRDRIDGPAPEPAADPLVQVRYVPPPPAEPPAPAAPDDQEHEDDEPDTAPERPWWSLPPGPFGRRTTAPEPDPGPVEQEVGPGLYVTVNQPAPAAPPWLAPDPAAERAAERLHRRRIWLAYHGGAAAAGWAVNLVDLMRDLLADAGPAAPAVGVAMGLVTWIVASYLPGLPYMPPALRPVLVWAARIPVCSAAIALALHAPGHL
ncbi:hypothetical protein I6J39_16840 [Streptomyces californicus]|uniref:Uncharacterized protein n=1 Tax=Streptomyces californicus TaxID=67351 RepID=A0ABX7J496_9ACTN|nr:MULTISPECIES: hypothetical protein [Streptomyces]QRV28790.1 hypothetical protein I6J39_16840 [Streptomyces californicus]QRV42204.1 hypothetical protein I6J41_16755 [Streptomyces californicus]